MKRISLPFKISLLMALAIGLISAAGYLAFKSLTSIVESIEVKSRPDLRLIVIKEISADLDKADNSVRMYRLTRDPKDIKPYYEILDHIDEKVDLLRNRSNNDSILSLQIDTISNFIEENLLVWNKMVELYHTDSLDYHIRKITAKIAVSTLNKKTEKSILKRVFGKKPEIDPLEQAQKEIISDLNRIEKQDSLQKSKLLQTETHLAYTGNEIRERLYLLISRMENEVISSIKTNSIAAEKLARKTYLRLAFFALLATLLSIVVVIVVIRYVRKTKEYQVALEKSKEETEQLSKTKEMFMANMSHEIRTPVNAIYGFAEQMIHEPLTEKSRQMTGIIRSTSEHLRQIVNDILDFSKLQNSKISLEKTHFFIRPLFEELKLIFRQSAGNNHTRLSYILSESVPPVLYGDPYRLKQIMMNLIGNAVKFTVNGKVCFSAEAESIDGENFNLVFTVSDTGIGINKKMQSLVFEDFTQAEAGISRKYGGTGLGLSIVKKLVELHHGKIFLESEEGSGTKITCLLPMTVGNHLKVAETEKTSQIPAFISKLRFLVVDDEDYNRLLFRTIFERWKVQFEEVNDGLKALEMIKHGNYDVVFMDARMPGMNGLEATSIIRNMPGVTYENIAIIGTSATHSIDDMKLYLASGMNGFLPKPFTENQLLDTIISVSKKNIQSVENESLITEKEFNSQIAGNNSQELSDNKNTGPSIKSVAQETETDNHRIAIENLMHLANNDLSFVKQLLSTFLQTTEKGLNDIEQLLHNKDYNGIRETAHKISSPCRHIGAANLYTCLKSMEEEAAHMKNITNLSKLSAHSQKEFIQIKKEVQYHLDKI